MKLYEDSGLLPTAEVDKEERCTRFVMAIFDQLTHYSGSRGLGFCDYLEGLELYAAFCGQTPFSVMRRTAGWIRDESSWVLKPWLGADSFSPSWARRKSSSGLLTSLVGEDPSQEAKRNSMSTSVVLN